MKVLLFFFLFFLMLVWSSFSVVIDLISLIMMIVLGSLIVFYLYNSFFIPFIINISLVGGLIVLISFVLIIQPNFSNISNFLINKAFGFFFVLGGLVFFSSSIIDWSSMVFFLSPLSFFSMLNSAPFVSVYLFLIALLFFMLFVIDDILKMKGGSYIIYN
uniref:NADH dehydrogenase subunit 6 n=1 Tax=Falcolipeurus quadripustulatus TaxID=2358485 RepID=A0A386B295_9NEOP|nr:NADH dehydrogenase subunit 6 [Falcolipeurus quadripustulatus]